MARLWTAFALGILAYKLRDRVRLSWAIAAALAAVTLAVQWLAGDVAGTHLRSVVIGYVALCLGFLTTRGGTALSARWPDYSYGMYIYAFPTMVAALAMLPGIDPYALMLLNVALTLPLAALSWHWVEKPALEWLRRRQHTAYEARGAPDGLPAPTATQ